MCGPWPSAFLVHGLWNVPPHSRLYRPSVHKTPKGTLYARHTGSPSFQGHPNCLKHPDSNSELIFDSVSSFNSTLGEKNLASISPSKALQILPLSLYSSLHLGPHRNFWVTLLAFQMSSLTSVSSHLNNRVTDAENHIDHQGGEWGGGEGGERGRVNRRLGLTYTHYCTQNR